MEADYEKLAWEMARCIKAASRSTRDGKPLSQFEVEANAFLMRCILDDLKKRFPAKYDEEVTTYYERHPEEAMDEGKIREILARHAD